MDSEGFLTERDKLLIIAVASAIFLITVILTTCVVSPWCFLYNWIVKPRQTPKQDALNVVYPPFANVTQNQLFRTETVKRSHNATFVNSNFVSEELPKSLLREGSIKLRVMDDERYANDVCLGEVSIAMKKILLTDPGADQEETLQAKNQTVEEENEPVEGSGQPDLLVYTLFPIKEVKGELFVGFCYLPTSKRVNITVVKGSIRNTFFSQFNNNTGQQVFYIRLLMFNNGKMLQKKKSGASVRLAWDETISFDLPEQMNDNLSFMLVLASKFQNPTSPTLPESPESPESQPGGISAGAEEVREPSTTTSRNNSSSSRKDFFVGHFVLDKEAWNEEIAKRPRKQILKWHKIY